jgi:ribosome biogenesis protein YTM1
MASGDWDGGLAIWNIPMESNGNLNETAQDESSTNKRLKGSNHKHIRTNSANIREVKPRSSTKAHSSNISGICFGYNNPNTVLTSSWDHSLKVYDTQRMDCILSMNGSRVITSMSRCINGNVVGTGCADCMVRLWDMRVGGAWNAVGGVGQVADKTLRQR